MTVPAELPTSHRCIVCGCDDFTACPGGCRRMPFEDTGGLDMCSACVGEVIAQSSTLVAGPVGAFMRQSVLARLDNSGAEPLVRVRVTVDVAVPLAAFE